MQLSKSSIELPASVFVLSMRDIQSSLFFEHKFFTVMLKSSFTLILLCSTIIFSACSSPNSGRNIGATTGAIIGGIVGSQLGDKSGLNIAAGAAIGGALGGLAGSEYDQKQEELKAAEAQRQYEYEQEVQEQLKLEREIEALEAKKVRDEIAKTATTADVIAAENEAARIEAELAAKKKAHAESQERARRIQAAQARIAKAQEELAALENQ